jgi:hypothetical protein
MPVLTLGARARREDRAFATMRSSATLQAEIDLLGPASGLVAAPEHGSMDPTVRLIGWAQVGAGVTITSANFASVDPRAAVLEVMSTLFERVDIYVSVPFPYGRDAYPRKVVF